MKRIVATVLLAPILALGLGACGDEKGTVSSNDYVGVCTDGQGNRVPDVQCDHSPNTSGGIGVGEAFMWYYLLSSASMPSYHTHVYGGYYTPPAGHTYYRGGVSSAGGRQTYSNYRPKSATDAKGKTVTIPKGGYTTKQKTTTNNPGGKSKVGNGGGTKVGGGGGYKPSGGGGMKVGRR